MNLFAALLQRRFHGGRRIRDGRRGADGAQRFAHRHVGAGHGDVVAPAGAQQRGRQHRVDLHRALRKDQPEAAHAWRGLGRRRE